MSATENKKNEIRKDWDQYWLKKDNYTNSYYDIVAGFYRNYIIRPNLEFFIKRHFKKGQYVLHAGCGSGKVDANIVRYLSVTALDISPPALELYRATNNDRAIIVQGNIFSLPFSNESFDGIYNLGVIEHFSEIEIQEILQEFKRVLRINGKIVLFIPPVFGLAAQVLDFIHFLFKNVFRKQIKLHPDEITRIKSKKHVKGMIEKAGYEYVEYYFGPKDLFTQILIVAKKIN